MIKYWNLDSKFLVFDPDVNEISNITDYSLREAFKRKKNKKCGNFPQGGGFGPIPHFFVKNKHGLKKCSKSF